MDISLTLFSTNTIGIDIGNGTGVGVNASDVGLGKGASMPMTMPIKPQEVWRAVRDGYAGDLMGHWFCKNGL